MEPYPLLDLARAGFIAVQILHSLVSVGIFSTRRTRLVFINSISTVSTELSNDKLSMSIKKIFYQKYGHLRPGTYALIFPSS